MSLKQYLAEASKADTLALEIATKINKTNISDHDVLVALIKYLAAIATLDMNEDEEEDANGPNGPHNGMAGYAYEMAKDIYADIGDMSDDDFVKIAKEMKPKLGVRK